MCGVVNFYTYGKILSTKNSGAKGLLLASELTTLFKDVVANGKFDWVPLYGILLNGIYEDDDGYFHALKVGM